VSKRRYLNVTTEPKSKIEMTAQAVQVVSVVAGVLISILSFNSARVKEFEARRAEAAKPFLALRQSLYLEAVKSAAILANPDTHSADEKAYARKRFRDLYVSELSMVESSDVASNMAALAAAVDPELRSLTEPQRAALNLAHALRDSFAADGGVLLRPHSKD
jgi:hypothetical protein